MEMSEDWASILVKKEREILKNIFVYLSRKLQLFSTIGVRNNNAVYRVDQGWLYWTRGGGGRGVDGNLILSELSYFF